MADINSIGYFLVCAALGYGAGSIPTGYWMGKILKGIDIREQGSGNPGATNVFRVVGKIPGIATLLIDALKGYCPVKIAFYIAAGHPAVLPQNLPGGIFLLPTLTAASAIMGHTWPVFLNFRGGKGVATSAGVFLALIPIPALVAIGFFIAMLFLTRYVSVGSITGAAILPVAAWLFTSSKFLTLLTAFSAVLIIFLHRKNIQRLIRHEEPKISFQKSEETVK